MTSTSLGLNATRVSSARVHKVGREECQNHGGMGGGEAGEGTYGRREALLILE